jgi:inner membrane protein
MKWQNHIIIGASFGTVINPLVIPAAILGATAPDWIEYILKIVGHKVKHRTVTHVVLYWLGAIAFFQLVIDYHHLGLGFAIGGFSHVIADSFTIAGVPFSPTSDARFHLFGGKLRTGNAGGIHCCRHHCHNVYHLGLLLANQFQTFARRRNKRIHSVFLRLEKGI